MDVVGRAEVAQPVETPYLIMMFYQRLSGTLASTWINISLKLVHIPTRAAARYKHLYLDQTSL